MSLVEVFKIQLEFEGGDIRKAIESTLSFKTLKSIINVTCNCDDRIVNGGKLSKFYTLEDCEGVK